MNCIRICVAAMLLCLAFACNEAKLNVNPEAVTAQDVALDKKEETADRFQEFKPAAPPGENEKQQSPQQSNVAAAPKMDWEKKIIKNANLNIEVANYDAFNQQVHTDVKRWGAYVAQEEQQSSEYKKENSIYIKVPVDQFDNLVQSITSGKDELIVKKITSEDVTGEVVDTRARMEARRQIRQRYMDLLKQAKNMEEILQVQTVIDDIQVQIESASGRINYLTHAASFSTVRLTFFQVLNPAAVNTLEPSFGQRVLESLKNGLLWVGELLLLLLNLWPLMLLGVIIFWGFKKWRSSMKLKTSNQKIIS